MFTFYSVSLILNSKVVSITHLRLSPHCVLTAVGDCRRGWGRWGRGGVQITGGLGSWWVPLALVPGSRPLYPPPAPLTSRVWTCPPWSFPGQGKLQESHLRFPPGCSPALPWFPNSMSIVLQSSTESGSLPDYLLVLQVLPDGSPDLAYPSPS